MNNDSILISIQKIQKLTDYIELNVGKLKFQ